LIPKEIIIEIAPSPEITALVTLKAILIVLER
jgi:hypothetical protein